MANYDENLILGYVEGELSETDRAKVESLLANDPQLSALVVGMVQDCVGLRSLPKEVPSSDLVDDVLGRFERGMLLGDPVEPATIEKPEVRRFRLGRIFAYSGLAALLLISGGLLSLSLMTGGLLEQAQEHAAVGEFFMNGGKKPVELQDRLVRAETAQDASSPASPVTQPFAAGVASDARSAAASGATKPDAMPEKTRSVEEIAMASASEPAPRQAYRLQRYTPPLIVQAPKAKAFSITAPSGDIPRGDVVANAEDANVAVAGLRVKVLTADPARAEREVMRWANTNAAVVVDEGALQRPTAALSVAEEAEAGEEFDAFAGYDRVRPTSPSERVVMVRIEPRQTLDFVQYLNRDGQEAGLVPLETVIKKDTLANGKRYADGLGHYARMNQQVVASRFAPEVEARRVQRRLAELERGARERQVGDADRSSAAMQPFRLEDSTPSPAGVGAASIEPIERPELERITLHDPVGEPAPAPVAMPAGRLTTNDWGLLFQYELPDPMLTLEPAWDVAAGEPALTVPVIISTTQP